MNNEQQLIATVQFQLKGLGYYLGVVDGEWGPLTDMALTGFKQDNGMVARPYPGPQTMSALFSPTVAKKQLPIGLGKTGEPMWLVAARSYLGLRETPGAANNPEIMKWAADLDLWYPGDATAWCGLFVAHCMSKGAPNEPQTFNRLGARNWLQYGEVCTPALGAVCALWRGSKDGWEGHVFIVTGINDTHVRGIGGNQSDKVSEEWFSLSRVLGYRKPTGVKLVAPPVAATGKLSTNEA